MDLDLSDSSCGVESYAFVVFGKDLFALCRNTPGFEAVQKHVL